MRMNIMFPYVITQQRAYISCLNQAPLEPWNGHPQRRQTDQIPQSDALLQGTCSRDPALGGAMKIHSDPRMQSMRPREESIPPLSAWEGSFLIPSRTASWKPDEAIDCGQCTDTVVWYSCDGRERRMTETGQADLLPLVPGEMACCREVSVSCAHASTSSSISISGRVVRTGDGDGEALATRFQSWPITRHAEHGAHVRHSAALLSSLAWGTQTLIDLLSTVLLSHASLHLTSPSAGSELCGPFASPQPRPPTPWHHPSVPPRLTGAIADLVHQLRSSAIELEIQ